MAKLTWKIWLLIILLIAAGITIFNWQILEGKVSIKTIAPNSSAAMAGLSNDEIIKEINGQPINSLEDYGKVLETLSFETKDISVKTENKTFEYKSATLDFTLENKTIVSVFGNALKAGLEKGMIVNEVNGMSLEEHSFQEVRDKIESKVKIVIKTNKNKEGYTFLTTPNLGITVSEVWPTRIKTGLDLQGGARAIVKPERPLTQQEMANLIETAQYRLNVYGLTDVNIREVTDLEGNSYMLVELAGATPSELQELLGKQGKFEAKIGNNTVFIGGHNDITFVCRNDASCARIETCSAVEGGEICRFHFEVHLSEAAAQKHAEITGKLTENFSAEGKSYLNETLDLYLDDKFVDSLLISSDLKGKVTTAVSVSGSGTGPDRLTAYKDAETNMKKLQTILITGSLPFKLEIIKLDSVSPTLGREFTRNVLIAGIAVFFGVCLIIYLRYRKIKLFIPVTITILSEAVLTLFIAALLKWNIDLAGIAGIIAAIGTGVDDQIVMIDESRTSKQYSLKERIKRAFFIIMAAYATLVVALLPLWWAGAGLLRGFAVTTLIGVTVGILVTRPAFADILSRITKD